MGIAIRAVHNPNSNQGSLSKETILKDNVVVEKIGAHTTLDLGGTLGPRSPHLVSVSLFVREEEEEERITCRSSWFCVGQFLG